MKLIRSHLRDKGLYLAPKKFELTISHTRKDKIKQPNTMGFCVGQGTESRFVSG